MKFTSDNISGVAPEVMQALEAANAGRAAAYGGDEWSRRLDQVFGACFEREVVVVPVVTGTAANALALATVSPPYGVVLCHERAHVNEHQCGAPEFYTGGAKLMPLSGDDGKIDPVAVVEALQTCDGPGAGHRMPASALSLTQATEAGTVYTPEALRALTGRARKAGLSVVMDGARFANAVAALGCTPAALSWQVGVDALCFGGTKNGAMAAEAVVFFDPEQVADIRRRRKRGGHLLSKQRYLAAQLLAMLEQDRWLGWAAHANAMAARLARGVAQRGGVTIAYPVDANMVFARMGEAAWARLRIYEPGLEAELVAPDTYEVRLVAAWDTTPEEVDDLLAALRG